VKSHIAERGKGLIGDHYVSHTGDDIAIVMTHRRGSGDPAVHKLAWDAFITGTAVAREQGLYGAGQDLLKDAFSGNVKGMGPAVAEMEFEERPNEPVLFFAADKTDPGAFNLPLYLAFADPMNTPGLILSPKIAQGFRFVIMDVNHTEGDRIVELQAPEELYQIAALRAVGSMCDADCAGLELRSQEFTFAPRRLRGGEFLVEVGTAGSITLVLQALLPAMLCAPAPSRVCVRGGTDVRAAPPLDYFRHVLLALLGNRRG